LSDIHAVSDVPKVSETNPKVTNCSYFLSAPLKAQTS
jgi:hypothetical protein